MRAAEKKILVPAAAGEPGARYKKNFDLPGPWIRSRKIFFKPAAGAAAEKLLSLRAQDEDQLKIFFCDQLLKSCLLEFCLK